MEKTYKVTVVYPLYFEVEAENEEEAEEIALEMADDVLAESSVEPLVHEIEELEK